MRVSFLFAIMTCICICPYVYSSEDTIQLDSGLIQGTVSAGSRSFRGIPYAAAPIGSLRWQPPQPVQAWNNIRQATQDGPACFQNCTLPPNTHTCPTVVSEDCLFVNVFTPRAAAINEPLPIMVFIHGGGFTAGYSGGPLYDGSEIANLTNTVVVAMNYRLGAFGFLSTNSGGINGNFGIMDQVFALRWVQANGAAFGGNTSRVTIFGESAGAVSVGLHLTIPASEGLYINAIMESNPFTIPLRDLSSMPPLAQCFAKQTGCALENAACMRNLDVNVVQDASKACETTFSADPKALNFFLPWTPIVDGNYILYQPLIAFAKGNYTRVPMVIGNTRDECVGFIYGAVDTNLTLVEYQALLGFAMGLKDLIPIDFEYPIPAHSTDLRDLASTVSTDWIMLCSNRNVTRSVAATSDNPVWYYSFNKVASFSQSVWAPDYWCYNSVCHGSELPFVFHSCTDLYNYTQSENRLSLSMVNYWAGLAHGGDVNYFNTQNNWPPYSENNAVMQFDDVNTITNTYRQKYCDFWDGLGYGF